LQPDSAKLPDNGDRDLLASDVGPDVAVCDAGGDVLAQVGAEGIVALAEDPGKLGRASVSVSEATPSLTTS
jgi:hypothetical protein